MAQAATKRLEALQVKPTRASINKDAGYRKQHQVGDYVIEYVEVRGQSWTVCRFPSRTDPGFPLRTDPA